MSSQDLSLRFAFACLLAAGCASNQLGPFDEDPIVQEIHARGPSPMELRVALAPLRITYDPTPQDGEGAPDSWAVEMDRHAIASVREELEDALDQESLFEDLIVLPEVPGSDPFQAAWDQRADLLIDVEIRGYRASYVKRTGWFVPNLLIWGYAWIPSWWVADERYRVEMEVRVSITSVHTGRKVWEQTYTPSHDRDLDDWERGWMLFGIVRVPGALGVENWEKIDSVVGPFAVRTMVVQLYADLHQEFRRFQDGPQFSRGMTKTLALIVGVTKYRYRSIRNIGYADRDARALREVLCQDGLGDVIPQNCKLLIDEDATKEGILDALENYLVERAEYPDTVIIYFAGNGGSWGKQPYLLPWDFDPDDPDTTGIDLKTLEGWLDRISCTNLVTIFDCSFLGKEDGRCYPLPGLTGDPVSESAIEGLASVERRRWVLLGARAGQSANEQDDIQNGIFSYFLLEGLKGRADSDEDGVVSLAELFEYLEGRVSRQAELRTGRVQTPQLIPELSESEADPTGFRITSPPPGVHSPG
ncbi:MAG: caspase family protein [Planctomycetota bacterium]|nr:caspase family protein [Planctomycetota bacterium]